VIGKSGRITTAPDFVPAKYAYKGRGFVILKIVGGKN
jgi:hypothetical protein